METLVKILLVVSALLIGTIFIYDICYVLSTIDPAMGIDGGFYDR